MQLGCESSDERESLSQLICTTLRYSFLVTCLNQGVCSLLGLILVCGGNCSLVMRVRIKDIVINVCIFDKFWSVSFVTFTLFTSSLFPSLPVSLLWPVRTLALLHWISWLLFKARLHKPPPVATHRLSQRLVCPPTSLPLFYSLFLLFFENKNGIGLP